MKQRSKWMKTICIVLSCIMLVMEVPINVMAADVDIELQSDVSQTNAYVNEGTQTIISESLSDFDNTLNNLDTYGMTCNSYMEKTAMGYQEILVDDKVHILDFDENGNLLSEYVMDFELPIFGGYYAGESYNYLVYGQKPSSEESEVYRVIKYDKDFNQLDKLSVFYKECYTSNPFYDGNVSIAESGNHMVVYTSRLRPDGHQSNIALRINTDTMEIENKYGMISFPDIHVSHSFRQIVKYDGEQAIYVDLGDSYPRAVCLQAQKGIHTNMLDVPGAEGDNVTNTDVSGLAITDTGYLVVGTQMRNYCSNIYLSYAQKGQVTAEVTWLTSSTIYNYSGVYNAKVIQVSNEVYAVMWNCFDNGGSVNYVMVNGQGELISDMKSLQGAELTQCEPIISDGKVIWSKYVDGNREVYSLEDFTCTGNYTWNDDYVLPENVWDGSADTSWYEDGKKEYHLETPEQIAGLAQLVNSGNTFEGKTIRIEKDMFFNDVDSIVNAWTSIAATSSGFSFEGTFDGQGHTFYNIYSISGEEGGVFGRIGEMGIVKAIKVSQSLMCGASIAYQNDGWILFCENNSLVENNDDTDYTAGICCKNTNLVYGCVNTGVIMGRSACGIVGINSGVGATIDSCWNKGLIKGFSYVCAGIVGSNYAWVYDCYNSGIVSGSYGINYAKTVAGVVGGHHGYDGQIYSCYNIGHLDIDDEQNWYCSDTICGEGKSSCENVYSIASKYNSSTEVTFEQLKKAETITKLQGEKIIPKWCISENSGYIVPIAQQDMSNGVYKMLPDVWNPTTEVTINVADEGYQLKAFAYAYYGIDNAKATYSSDSDILSITLDGIISPLNKGAAIVKVNFGGAEHTKETSFDVQVTIVGTNDDGNNSEDDTTGDIPENQIIKNDETGIPDTVFYGSVLEITDSNDDEILTIEEAELLTSLNVLCIECTNIKGIKYFKNLKKLDLSGNAINDINELSELTNLEYLYLDSNAITDISALSCLSNLKELYISFNKITDVSALSSLLNLTKLDISYNQITDISSLEDLIFNLEEFYYEGNTFIEDDVSSEPEKPAIVEGWKKDNVGWWYQNADGTYPSNCWKMISGKWYAFDTKGYMREGWFYDAGKWYYLIPGSGAMATGWVQVGGTWYYMNSSGAMVTGWLKDGGTWYYMKSSGVMATGWVNDGGTWYYMKSSGAMATGWVKDGNTWYYMKSSGAMATGWIQDGGTWYYLNASGAWVA